MATTYAQEIVFDHMPQAVQAIMEIGVKSIHTATEQVLYEAQASCPVDTGTLLASHVTEYAESGLVSYVHAKAPYALWVHEGTRRMAGRPWLAKAAVHVMTPLLDAWQALERML